MQSWAVEERGSELAATKYLLDRSDIKNKFIAQDMLLSISKT